MWKVTVFARHIELHSKSADETIIRLCSIKTWKIWFYFRLTLAYSFVFLFFSFRFFSFIFFCRFFFSFFFFSKHIFFFWFVPPSFSTLPGFVTKQDGDEVCRLSHIIVTLLLQCWLFFWLRCLVMFTGKTRSVSHQNGWSTYRHIRTRDFYLSLFFLYPVYLLLSNPST